MHAHGLFVGPVQPNNAAMVLVVTGAMVLIQVSGYLCHGTHSGEWALMAA